MVYRILSLSKVFVCFSLSLRETFSKNAIDFCRLHGFDGVDLDWEFPAANHRKNFGLLLKVTQVCESDRSRTLLQTMHKVFKKEAKKSNKDRLLLSLAVAAGKVLVKQGYDVPVLCQ